MPYVLISPEQAEPFSRALCRLMRPTHLRSERDVTDLYCPVHYHESNGWAALELPDTETVPVHIDATGAELMAEMQIFVQKGSLTLQEAQGIGGAVGAMKGAPVRIADFVPPSWQDKVKTREQMDEEGWFPKADQI